MPGGTFLGGLDDFLSEIAIVDEGAAGAIFDDGFVGTAHVDINALIIHSLGKPKLVCKSPVGELLSGLEEVFGVFAPDLGDKRRFFWSELKSVEQVWTAGTLEAIDVYELGEKDVGACAISDDLAKDRIGHIVHRRQNEEW